MCCLAVDTTARIKKGRIDYIVFIQHFMDTIHIVFSLFFDSRSWSNYFQCKIATKISQDCNHIQSGKISLVSGSAFIF